MLETVIDGKSSKEMLTAMPTSLVLRLYRVDRTEDHIKLAEKVVL